MALFFPVPWMEQRQGRLAPLLSVALLYRRPQKSDWLPNL